MPAPSPEPVRAFSPGAAPRRARRGFTLIELLVVIGIIAVLGGLVVVAIMSFAGEGRDDLTRTRMEILNNFMASYGTSEASRGGGQGNVDAAKLPSVLQVAPGAGDYYSTFDGFSDSNQANVTDSARMRVPLAAPPIRFTEEVWVAEPAVARTQAVLRRLLTIPGNQSAFASLPEDARTQVVTTSGSILAHVTPTASTSPLDPAVLVDGHNNPILFVPAQGLTHLWFRDGSRNVTVRATHNGPFWVSAGPDGLFGFHSTTGDPGPDGILGTDDDVGTVLPGADDNVYSTTVIRVSPTTAPIP